jgi:hypothetical protein
MSDRVERRLAAILAADVAGYSRLMGADEEGTHERLKALRREPTHRAPPLPVVIPHALISACRRRPVGRLPPGVATGGALARMRPILRLFTRHMYGLSETRPSSVWVEESLSPSLGQTDQS